VTALTHAETGPPAKPIDKADTWTLADYKATLATIKAISANAEEFTDFEADFLAELARVASRFREKFRMSPKQISMLEDLDTKFLLVRRIKAKVKKADPAAKKLMDEIFKPGTP
jgi:hypothetical protein